MKRMPLPKLSSLNRRERLLAVGSIVMLLLWTTDSLVLGPWWRDVRRIRREISQLERAIAPQQQLLFRRHQVLAEVNAYRDYVRATGAGDVEMAELLREVELLGTNSGIVLREVKPLPVTLRQLRTSRFTIHLKTTSS